MIRDSKGKFVKGGNGYWKGKKLPKSVIDGKIKLMTGKKGSETPRWKGGKPKCLGCGIQLSAYKCVYCCKCLGKNKIGANHPNWKGGYENKLMHNKKRRVRKLSAEGYHSLKEWQELKEKYNNMCLCCKKNEPEITLSEDHIVPLSKGGSDNIENIQPLCKSCNSIKHDKIIAYV